ncbi:MAG: hypothetical protein ACR2RD_16220 [Woeseiaceae bacterium]
MRSSTFPPAALAELHSACETEPALLNSERIQQRFGSFGIAILRAETGLRRSSIFSWHGKNQVCRTYAVVRFAEQPVEWYREEHAKVLAGNSIGAIFRSHGWDVHKQTLHIGHLSLPDKGSSIAELMQLDDESELAMHVYQLLLVRQEQVFEYAAIVETHHPAYLTEADLRDLYEFDASTALSSPAISELTSLVLNNHE